MGRKAVEINPKTGKRLRQICQEQGVRQTELSEVINVSQEHISNIVRGKKGLSKDIAYLICRNYPQYRIEWLLGEDDIKTIADQVALNEKKREEGNKARGKARAEQISAIISLLHDDSIQRKENGGILIKGTFYPTEGLYVGTELTKEQTDELIREIEELVRMRMRWLFHAPFPGGRLMRMNQEQENQ